MKLVIDIGENYDGTLKQWTEEIVMLRIRAALLRQGGNVCQAASG